MGKPEEAPYLEQYGASARKVTCSCRNSKALRYIDLVPKEWADQRGGRKYTGYIPPGTYCEDCLKPKGIPAIIWAVLKCSSCDNLYPIEGTKTNVPDRFKLCSACNSKLPTRRIVKRVKP